MATDKNEETFNIVTLRTAANEKVCQIKLSKLMQQLVYQWNYKVRNRNRWKAQSDACKAVQTDAAADLLKLGVKAEMIKELAKAGVVEVCIPYISEGFGWEARTLPWEYLISAATKEERGNEPICVVRHLDVRKSVSTDQEIQPVAPATNKTEAKTTTKHFAVIESAPDVFREIKSFDTEREFVAFSLRSMKSIKFPGNPDEKQIRSILKTTKGKPSPDVIHVTGIDAHRGHEKLATLDDKKHKCDRDGIYVSSPKKGFELLDAEKLGKLLTTAEKVPTLVGLNCWYSGARIAPQCIARGAQSALGIQNTFDDFVAEVFFANFYQAWVEGKQDVLSAFLQAWESVKPYSEQIKGSGLILWSRSSLVGGEPSEQEIQANSDGLEDARNFFVKRQERQQEESQPADPAFYDIRDLVGVRVKPVKNLNYSMLHNRRSILDELRFWLKVPKKRVKDEKAKPGHEWTSSTDDVFVQDLEVEVKLFDGANTFPYRTRLTLSRSNPSIDLADVRFESAHGNPDGGVQVPLISDLLRSVDERMQTSLFIEVRWHDQVLYCNTHSVSLTPTNEWMLTDQDICWLPSFVQPRDPVVDQIVTSAKKYLRALSDDPMRGFNGYQMGTAEEVNMQVQAIWSAIVYEYPMVYIGPPPSYSPNAQRLRTPSQVIGQSQGTCVDLVLLMAACLEWIELYPVIVNTEIHAFVAYWISTEARDEFLQVHGSGGSANSGFGMGQEECTTTSQQEWPWISGKDAYDEIREHVHNDQLVPIECTCLPEIRGYKYAATYAKAYFRLGEAELEQYETRQKELKSAWKSEEKKRNKLEERGAPEKSVRAANRREKAARKKFEEAEAELELMQKDFTEEFTELGIKVSDLENGEINPATDPHYYYDNFHSLVDICTSRAHVTPLPLGPDQME